jgi:uncharacterized protein (TIGR00159 family)
MIDSVTQWLSNQGVAGSFVIFLLTNFSRIVDLGLLMLLIYVMLLIIGERRTLWMVRGFIALMFAAAFSRQLSLTFLSFVLNNLVIGSAVAMAFILQSEFRRFLELLGRGDLRQLLQPARRSPTRSNSGIDEIVDAVKDLSQNRTGALMILELEGGIDERDFSVPGVKINAELSRELIQTIFQTTTLLHDGALLIRERRIISAGVILPLSERTASRQLGTRHRAAMGITERVENCVCIVVSEETGSISLVERGILNRPLTSNKLKELLEEKFETEGDRADGKSQMQHLLERVRSRARFILRQIYPR